MRLYKFVLFLFIFIFGSLFFSQPIFADTSGPNDPLTINNTVGVGTVEWNNLNQAQTFDTSYATAPSLANGEVSNYLQSGNYNFNIPTNATILGIKADISRKASFSDRIKDQEVKIVKASDIVGINKAGDTTWSNSETVVNYGGENDLWGETWTPDDINDSSFGLAIAVTNTGGGSRTASINSIQITITYSVPVVLSSIAISAPATKLVYIVGDVLDTTGLVVTGTYSDASTQIESFTNSDITGFDSSVPIVGQVLTITIGGKTTTYTIDVNLPPDTIAPIITLNGSDSITLDFGKIYNEAGATAVDNVDGSVNVVITGTVDSKISGSYIITYTATDIAGNISTATRTVVVDKEIVGGVVFIPSSSNILVSNPILDANPVQIENQIQTQEKPIEKIIPDIEKNKTITTNQVPKEETNKNIEPLNEISTTNQVTNNKTNLTNVNKNNLVASAASSLPRFNVLNGLRSFFKWVTKIIN